MDVQVQFQRKDGPTDLTPNFTAIFHDEGDYYLQELKGVGVRICAGCGAKAAFCPTWGACDWETVPADDLEEYIQKMAEDRDCIVKESPSA